MKRLYFAALLTAATFSFSGCGQTPDTNSADAKKTANSADSSNSKNNSAKDAVKSPEKRVKVESTLPFKDLDVATANKGIDPGRILIDSKGKDSAGKALALSDYKGKVILLDTWASW